MLTQVGLMLMSVIHTVQRQIQLTCFGAHFEKKNSMTHISAIISPTWLLPV